MAEIADAPSWADVLALVIRLDASTYGDVEIRMPGLHVRMSTSPTVFAAASSPVAAAPPTEASPAPVSPAPVPTSPTAVEVTTPMLGTFYGRPAPDAAPFVAVGDSVGPDTTVGIIEVMKLMNPVTAGVTGRVVEVCAADGDMVEHGQVLFRIEPGS